ncbi:hypothetical protein [Chromobacterium alticapitis]|uniref:Uncharacterized protein n=1 Tax=Chromobacterium alticapitis TaxID=2073169 RepID=A0A2S5DI92_9NEIS|nr:hypothetical protein [Chromobacterium alticapitis]POZ62805.1 hypothetical protein C2I19_06530 [Chromobacterium alticapitis]
MNPPSLLALRLTRNPGHGRAQACASVNLPLLEAQDYARREAHASGDAAPVLLNHKQFYALLERLLRQAWAALGEDCRVFVQLRQPTKDLALPAALFDPRVLLGAGLLREAQWRAESEPAPVVWIAAENLRRDLLDDGDNIVRIACWNVGETGPAALLPALETMAPQTIVWTESAPGHMREEEICKPR